MEHTSAGSGYHCTGIRVEAEEAHHSFLQLDHTLDTGRQAIFFMKCMGGLAAWEQRHT